jgi:hypothetical protein
MKHLGTALASAVTLLLLAAVPASRIDAHGGDPNLVHACVKSNGTIRIIAPSGSCGVNETSLDWGLQGPQGPKGDPGDDGANGADGADGVSGYEVVTTNSLAGAGQTVETNVVCPPGKRATGGGVRGEDAAFGTFIVHGSAPDPNNHFNGWIAQVTNQDGAPRIFTIYVICALVN